MNFACFYNVVIILLFKCFHYQYIMWKIQFPIWTLWTIIDERTFVKTHLRRYINPSGLGQNFYYFNIECCYIIKSLIFWYHNIYICICTSVYGYGWTFYSDKSVYKIWTPSVKKNSNLNFLNFDIHPITYQYYFIIFFR